MTSPARLAADRRNARRSTGPRTPEGKRASSANALKHGLCAERVLAAGEDAAEFGAFAAGMTTDLAPVGATETFLCRKIVASAWRLRRAVEAEAALFEPNDAEGLMYTGFRWEPNHRMFALLTAYEARLERSYYRAFAALKALQRERRAVAARAEPGEAGGEAPRGDGGTGARAAARTPRAAAVRGGGPGVAAAAIQRPSVVVDERGQGGRQHRVDAVPRHGDLAGG